MNNHDWVFQPSAPAGPTCCRSCVLQAPADLSKIVVKQHGFSFTDEGRGKWGFLATVADMTMELEVDASLPPALLPPQTSNASGSTSANSTSSPHQHMPGVHVNLGLLHSYEHMGIVNVACVQVGKSNQSCWA